MNLRIFLSAKKIAIEANSQKKSEQRKQHGTVATKYNEEEITAINTNKIENNNKQIESNKK